MTKPWLHILFILGIAIVITIAVFLLFYPVPITPVAEVKHALETLAAARDNEAETYAPELYREASGYYDSAMVNWRYQNSRFLYKRDYSKVFYFAEQSSKKALQASANSLNCSANLKINFTEKLKEADRVILLINTNFNYYPLPQKVRSDISAGKMLNHEARIAYDEGKYSLADDKINESLSILSSSYTYANTSLRNYFKPYPQWKIWIDSTLTLSSNNDDYSIIIDKYSHRFFVYLDGEIISVFPAELGQNWIGDKRRSGDMATPEGMYKIVKLIEGDSTDYHKALLLDYPNSEDSVRFRLEKERGLLSASAAIGENIQIHGGGGKGADWTSGCIALRNRDIDSLFKLVRIGTPVTIVGSMYNMKQALNR